MAAHGARLTPFAIHCLGQELLTLKLLEKKFVRGKKGNSEESLEPAGDMLYTSIGVCI